MNSKNNSNIDNGVKHEQIVEDENKTINPAKAVISAKLPVKVTRFGQDLGIIEEMFKRTTYCNGEKGKHKK